MLDTNRIVASVVLPCLNERKTVGVCIQKALCCLDRMKMTGEVIVADNGSDDGSQDIAEAAGARVVHCIEKGYGAALRCGITAARGCVIVMADADDSYDLGQLGDFVLPIRDDLADVVIGNRFAGGIESGAMPLLNRYVGNPTLSLLLRVLFGGSVKDAHCGLRSFSRNAFDQIAPYHPGMEFASELIVRALQLNLRILEIPTTLRVDGRDRKPHLRPWRDGWRHVRYLFGEWWSPTNVPSSHPLHSLSQHIFHRSGTLDGVFRRSDELP